MGLTTKQFNAYMRLVLDAILEVLEKMQDGEEKVKLQKIADNLQQTITG